MSERGKKPKDTIPDEAGSRRTSPPPWIKAEDDVPRESERAFLIDHKGDSDGLDELEPGIREYVLREWWQDDLRERELRRVYEEDFGEPLDEESLVGAMVMWVLARFKRIENAAYRPARQQGGGERVDDHVVAETLADFEKFKRRMAEQGTELSKSAAIRSFIRQERPSNLRGEPLTPGALLKWMQRHKPSATKSGQK